MFHPDFKDLLAAFAKHEVEHLIIGGYAVGFHAEPRFTKDLDLWLSTGPANIERACRALEEFGAPDQTLADLRNAKPNEIVWLGSPPLRIDLLQSPPGGNFSAMYQRRINAHWNEVSVKVIGRDDLIILKRAAGRSQDLLDVEALQRAAPEQDKDSKRLK